MIKVARVNSPNDIFLPFPFSPHTPQKGMGVFFYVPIPTVIEMIIGVGTEHQNLIKTPIDVNILTVNLYAVNE